MYQESIFSLIYAGLCVSLIIAIAFLAPSGGKPEYQSLVDGSIYPCPSALSFNIRALVEEPSSLVNVKTLSTGCAKVDIKPFCQGDWNDEVSFSNIIIVLGIPSQLGPAPPLTSATIEG